MHDIFISYSSANKQIADAICHYFEARNLRCWYAPRDVRPGKDYRTEIMSAIGQTKCLILIYTNDSNHSRDVMNEITAAFKAEIPILPLRVEDVEMEPALAYYLNGVHWLDAITPPIEHNIQVLHRTVCGIIDKDVIEPDDEVKTDDESKTDEKSTDKVAGILSALKEKRLIPILAGVVAALIIILIAVGFGKGQTGEEKIQKDTVSEQTESSLDEAGSAPAVEVDITENILMENQPSRDTEGNISEALEVEDVIFNTNITRRQVKTITFLDTLSQAPDTAVDASALGNGKVKAWAEFAETANSCRPVSCVCCG